MGPLLGCCVLAEGAHQCIEVVFQSEVAGGEGVVKKLHYYFKQEEGNGAIEIILEVHPK